MATMPHRLQIAFMVGMTLSIASMFVQLFIGGHAGHVLYPIVSGAATAVILPTLALVGYHAWRNRTAKTHNRTDS